MKNLIWILILVVGVYSAHAESDVKDEAEVKDENGHTLRECEFQDLEVTRQSTEVRDEVQIEVKVKSPDCYASQNSFYAGLSGGSIFFYGGQAQWLHRTKSKRPIFHVELEHARRPFVQTSTVGVAGYALKTGVFFGLKAGLLTIHNTLIDGDPYLNFKVIGADLGWYHAWGKRKRILTGIKVSTLLVPNADQPAVTLEGRASVGFRFK